MEVKSVNLGDKMYRGKEEVPAVILTASNEMMQKLVASYLGAVPIKIIIDGVTHYCESFSIGPDGLIFDMNKQ